MDVLVRLASLRAGIAAKFTYVVFLLVAVKLVTSLRCSGSTNNPAIVPSNATSHPVPFVPPNGLTMFDNVQKAATVVGVPAFDIVVNSTGLVRFVGTISAIY